MVEYTPTDSTNPAWTLRKAVTTLAIAPQTEALTRTGRMAYNLMIYWAQRSTADADGGYSAPLSQIVKGYGGTTRDSARVRTYIEQMCTTLVRWFPLSSSDEAQASFAGMEPPLTGGGLDGRVFTLLSEARWARRAGEQWVTWFFPPTIRDMVIEPSRWAQLDIQEMARLSHYVSVALYEICARYRDFPGGLTNRAEPAFWVQVLRSDPETKPREWRKFKCEALKLALAEINQKTSLAVELIEERKGRAVVGVRFAVSRKESVADTSPVDLTLVDLADRLGVKERDLDQLVDEYGEAGVRKALEAMEGRTRAQPTVPIKSPAAYLRKTLRNGSLESLFTQPSGSSLEPVIESNVEAREPVDDEWLAARKQEIREAVDSLDGETIERFAGLARTSLAAKGLLSVAMQRRFDQKQYRSPMVLEFIRSAYAESVYGVGWKVLRTAGDAGQGAETG